MVNVIGLRTTLVGAIAFMLVLPSDIAHAGSPGAPHLPDLRTLPPTEISVTSSSSKTGSSTELRFTNSIWNAGLGPLELRPVNSGGTTTAYQRVYTHSKGGVASLLSETPVGTFVFHAAHNHWHFEGFARYQLRGVNPDGSMGPVLRTTDKVSFCIINSFSHDATLEHYGWGGPYSTCPAGATQGISVGWADRYRSNLAGQSIDISGLQRSAGTTYWLVSEVDYESRLSETNEANNATAVKIQFAEKGAIRVIG